MFASLKLARVAFGKALRTSAPSPGHFGLPYKVVVKADQDHICGNEHSKSTH